MMHEFENPFADYGGIVHGDRFIGRQESLSVIESRLIQPREPANLAIIGQPRSGKSSLVYQALIERKEQLIEKNLIPIKVTLSTYQQSEDFFQALVNECLEQLEDLDRCNEGIQSAADRANEHQLSWDERYRKIQRFFKRVRETGYHILFVLDEFDSTRTLFKDNVPDFQKLRELAYQPDLGVALVTTSRRSIKTIELQTGDISTLSGIFQHHYLGMFDANDLKEFFDRLVSAGVEVSEELERDVLSYCGGYPYLLAMLGFEIIEMCKKGQEPNVEKAVNQISQALFGHYHQIVNLLEEDGSLDSLLQILFGPVIDVKPETVNEFLGYGLVRETDDGTFVGFSKHFHDYLRLTQRQIGVGGALHVVWRKTEIALREQITTTMLDKYGENWVEELEKRHPRFSRYNKKTSESGPFEECRILQGNDSNPSLNLIDYTYPKTLFDIISAEWNSCFREIFGKDKQYWDRHGQLISRIRTPLAHNRPASIPEFDRQKFEGYCNEILHTLQDDPNQS